MRYWRNNNRSNSNSIWKVIHIWCRQSSKKDRFDKWKRFIPTQHIFLKPKWKKKLINNHEMWVYLLRTFGNKEAYDWHRMFCFATDRYHQRSFYCILAPFVEHEKRFGAWTFFSIRWCFLMNSLRERNSSYVWYNN